MPISPVGAIPIPNISALSKSAGVGAPATTGAEGASGLGGIGGAGSGGLFTQTLKGTAEAQSTADKLVTQAATGDLTDLTSVMSAMTEAQLATQLTVAMRNKAVESFNEIMRMQL